MEKEQEKKHRQYTDAHRKATNKYRQERAQIVVVMTKAQREQIKQAATDNGQSVNQFILDKVLKGLD
jgi:uncharacterized protein (DUF1778 family)